jgi:hypothetical protein
MSPPKHYFSYGDSEAMNIAREEGQESVVQSRLREYATSFENSPLFTTERFQLSRMGEDV